MSLILLYLVAIVAANLTTAAFGPEWSIVNAFLFIGLDLTTRDALHERWQGAALWPNMAALIGAGSVLSVVCNLNALSIAVASFLAFIAAGVVDTLIYSALHERAKLVKINGSNVVSAAVDSLVFPTLAFGSFMPLIVLGQFAAKVFGGYLWSLVIARRQ